MIVSILGAIAAIFIVVLIHELGHYTVARLLKVKVLKFSIGFGKALCSYTSKKTGIEYAISMIPLGGYVKMYGDQPDQEVDPKFKHQAFNAKPVWARMAIVLAGPFANIILAIVAFLFVYMIGVSYVKPVIGHVTPDSIAAKADFKSGQQIIEINGRKIYGWQQVMTSMLADIGNSKKLKVETQHDGLVQIHQVDLSHWRIEKRSPDIIGSLGFVPHYMMVPPIILKVMADSPALHAGIKAGDRIVNIAGKPVTDWRQVLNVIQKSADKKLAIVVKRAAGDVPLTLHVGSEALNGKTVGHIGAMVKLPKMAPSMMHTIQYGFIDSIANGAQRTWNLFVLNIKILGKMFSGAVSVNTLGGPISVFKTAGQASQAGWSVYLSFIAFISVALGFINLLPIPMLDGGHFFFYVIEVLTRKPVPMRYQILGMKIGILLIVWLMVQATINDVLRLV